MDERGVSTQIGMLLATVVVVATVSVPAFVVFDGFGSEATPQVDIDGAVTTDAVSLTNAGGDPVEQESLSVVVSTGAESTRVTPAVGGELEPGETWTHAISQNLSAGDRVDVYVTHTPTDEVVFEGSLLVNGTAAGAPTVTASANDDTIVSGASTQLSASASDPNGDDLTYAWDLEEGASAATLASTDADTATLTAGDVDSNQTVVAVVTVSDGSQSASDTVEVTVTPPPDDDRPSVESFSASEGEGSGELDVRLAVDERLGSLEVTVERTAGLSDDRVLTLGDFSATESGSTVVYEATVSGLEEGEYRVSVQSGEDGAGNALTSTPTVTAEVRANEPPVIEEFEVEDGSGKSHPRIDLEVSDPEGWSDGAEVEVVSLDDGEVVDSTTVDIADADNPAEFDSDENWVDAPHDQEDGESYTVRVTVTDGDGGETTAERSVPFDAPGGGNGGGPGNGNGNGPPSGHWKA